MARKIVKGRVTPCFVNPGYIPIDFAKALDLSANANMNQTTFFAASNARINEARTMVVRAFLEETDSEWAWFLDTDMVFAPDTLPRLLKTAHEKKAKVVAALCFVYAKSQGAIYPNMYWKVEDRKPGQSRYKHAAVWPNEPFEVDGTGGACLLVHREVLKAIGELYKNHPQPWQTERIDEHSGLMEGEDLVFCQKIQETGYKIWYDPRIAIGHIKEVTIGIREYNAFVAKNAGNLVVSP